MFERVIFSIVVVVTAAGWVVVVVAEGVIVLREHATVPEYYLHITDFFYFCAII